MKFDLTLKVGIINVADTRILQQDFKALKADKSLISAVSYLKAGAADNTDNILANSVSFWIGDQNTTKLISVNHQMVDNRGQPATAEQTVQAIGRRTMSTGFRLYVYSHRFRHPCESRGFPSSSLHLGFGVRYELAHVGTIAAMFRPSTDTHYTLKLKAFGSDTQSFYRRDYRRLSIASAHRVALWAASNPMRSMPTSAGRPRPCMRRLRPRRSTGPLRWNI